jgi:tRNA (adenine-N(1)-)-methyltransferase non-catalytic subunit
VTAAMMERMGCEGRIMTFTENDSPPGGGVLGVMTFSERELDCVRWLNWMEADEAYQRRTSISRVPMNQANDTAPPPPEDDMPAMAMNKRLQRLRKAHGQVAELNAKRDELHLGGWDG